MPQLDAIVVLGMHRSGTSAITRALGAFNVNFGQNLMPPVRDNNPKGFFEDLEISRHCDRILASARKRWDSPVYPFEQLPYANRSLLVQEAKEILASKLDRHKVFCFKNPRLCIVLPVWQEAFELLGVRAKYLIAHRHPFEVARSLEQRDHLAHSQSLLLWTSYSAAAFHWTQQESRLVLEYSKLLETPDSVRADLAKFLEPDLGDCDEAAWNSFSGSFLDQELRHHDVTDLKGSEELLLPDATQDLYKFLSLMAERKASTLDSEMENEWLRVEKEIENYRVAFDFASTSWNRINELTIQKRNLEATLDKQLAQTGAFDHEPDENPLVEINDQLQEMDRSVKDLGASVEASREKQEADSLKINSRLDALKDSNERIEHTHSSLLKSLVNIEGGFGEFERMLDSRFDESVQSSKRHDELLLAIYEQNRDGLSSIDTRLLNIERVQSQLLDQAKAVQEQQRIDSAKSLQAARAQVEALNKQLRVYENSKSMRLTAPLRRLRRISAKLLPSFQSSRIHEAQYIQEPLEARARTTPAAQPSNEESKTRDIHESINQSNPEPLEALDWSAKSRILSALDDGKVLVHQEVPEGIRSLANESVECTDLSVSVIIPTWNREHSVIRAIHSVLAQSRPVNQIIVSDDGSDDKTLEVVRSQFAKQIQDNLLVLLENTHAGVCATRNAGMAVATGDLFLYLDSDNEWTKDYVLMMVAAFTEQPELMTAYAGLRSKDLDSEESMERASRFDRRRLIDGNFIDLNIFAHRRCVYEQMGDFDLNLKRLVDWDLIVRYTRVYTPMYLPFIGVNYYLSAKELNNITHTVPLDENRSKVLHKNFFERVQRGLDTLKIAYFVYDYPALSQTFVLNEIRWLIRNDFDVVVYFHTSPDVSADVDFEVQTHQVDSASELAELFLRHDRNVCHTQFAYPGVTLFVHPACEMTGVYFSFMPHAVDLFHEANIKRNKIDVVANDPLCRRVWVYGDHHLKFLESKGVDKSKVSFAFQSVDTGDFVKADKRVRRRDDSPIKAVVIARLIEKKGIRYLLEAIRLLPPDLIEVEIFGWGPLEDELKSMAQEWKITNVSFCGPVHGPKALEKLYAQADLLIAPCVQASNGDIDGFPTVILEAIAGGVPVLTTKVSSIPDHLRDGIEAILVEPASPTALVEGIQRYARMSGPRIDAIVSAARRFLDRTISTERTMRRIVESWQDQIVDIVMVTFNRDGYDDRNETFEIVERVLTHTTTPFILTIVDNDSDASFWTELVERVRGYRNVRLIRNSSNLLCGPATNVALEHVESDFFIYICSKEGFVKRHGWERPLLDYMKDNPDAALGGHLVNLPRFTLGRELSLHPDFPKFRRPDFAHANPDRIFKHVQGGIFVGRTKILRKFGYNPALPQGNMDVEFSFLLEAEGYKLGEIPEVVSVTTKTLPRIETRLNESTAIAHPLSLENVHKLDLLNSHNAAMCNICGTFQDGNADHSLFDLNEECSVCRSTSFGRTVFRALTDHHLIHRNLSVAVVSRDNSLIDALSERMFTNVLQVSSGESLLHQLKQRGINLDVLLIDPLDLGEPTNNLWSAFVQAVDSACTVLMLTDSPDSVLEELNKRFTENGLETTATLHDINSCAGHFDWRKLIEISVRYETTNVQALA